MGEKTSVTASEVKKLRESTGAGVMECKRALEDTSGDFDQAVSLVKERGLEKAASRSSRGTNEGLVEAYIHPNRPIGAMISLSCETDFVARTDDFRNLARDLCMHIAAMDPACISPDQSNEGEPLLSQPFVKDPGRKVADVIQEVAAKTGENVKVSEFSRFEIGS